MSEQCVVAIYESFDAASEGVQALEELSFPQRQVSFVTHSLDGEVPVPQHDAARPGVQTEREAAKGAGMGGLIGLLLSTPLLTVSGLGSLLIAGPIAAGLAGAVVGGFLGAMNGWGVDANRIREYERRVAEGAFLIVANGTPDQVANAQRALQETSAEEVNVHATPNGDNLGR